MHIETLLECNDSDLDYYECKFIDQYRTLAPHGYNLKTGGLTNQGFSDESRRKISESLIRRHRANKPDYMKDFQICKWKHKFDLRKDKTFVGRFDTYEEAEIAAKQIYHNPSLISTFKKGRRRERNHGYINKINENTYQVFKSKKYLGIYETKKGAEDAISHYLLDPEHFVVPRSNRTVSHEIHSKSMKRAWASRIRRGSVNQTRHGSSTVIFGKQRVYFGTYKTREEAERVRAHVVARQQEGASIQEVKEEFEVDRALERLLSSV